MDSYAPLRVADPDNGWEKSVTLLLIVAITAACQLLGHCCCGGNGQSDLPTGASCEAIPLAEVASLESMQHKRWGDVAGGGRAGSATAAAPAALDSAAAAHADGSKQEQQEETAGQKVDDSNFVIADGDDYEEF